MSKKEEMLPSTEREWKEKVKAEKNRADTIFGAVTRKHIGIIVRAKYLTTEHKELLIAEINVS